MYERREHHGKKRSEIAIPVEANKNKLSSVVLKGQVADRR
jgi:hypothetical protein